MKCSRCSEEKGADQFYARNRSGDAYWCKACRRAYYATPEWRARFNTLQREARAEKRAWALDVKVSQGCADCGESHPACLDFHHRDPSEKHSEVVKMIDSNAGWERIKAEVEKCDVLCSNCHRKRHYIEREAAKALRLA